MTGTGPHAGDASAPRHEFNADLVTRILEYAVVTRASDVHIEANPTGKNMRIRFRKRVKNHVGSMYFGALMAGADLAGGLAAIKYAHDKKLKLSLVFKDAKGEFLKRAEGDVYASLYVIMHRSGGGPLKDRALALEAGEEQLGAFSDAFEAYHSIYLESGDSFPGINAATLAFMGGESDRAQQLASDILADPDVADATYVEPLVPDVVERILERERPDAVLPTVGGQTALNLAMELAKRGVLERLGIELIGARPDVIDRAENREKFKACMDSIGLGSARSFICHNLADAQRAKEAFGLPLVIRPAYSTRTRPSPSARGTSSSTWPPGTGTRCGRSSSAEPRPRSSQESWPSGASISTRAAPVPRSTCHSWLPTTVPAGWVTHNDPSGGWFGRFPAQPSARDDVAPDGTVTVVVYYVTP